jgi:hypothetical protein
LFHFLEGKGNKRGDPGSNRGERRNTVNSIGLPEVLVMVGIVVMCLIVPLVALVLIYLVRRLRTQERLRAIEKGLAIPESPADDPWERISRIRRGGIALVAGGLGLLVFLALQAGGPNAGIAAVPILIGLGFLYDYRLTARDLRARQASQAPDNTTRQQ